jgi:hypothetical protein
MTFETLVNIIVFVNLALTIGLLQTAVRRPEKLKRKFRKRLWQSKPINPKHEPPPPLKKGLFVDETKLQFFSDFEDFADVVNSWLTASYDHPHGGPWRLQQLPRSDLLWLDTGQPTYGRAYAVFHNQVSVGEIEIRPLPQYSTQDPRVEVYVELDWVRLLHFETIRSFLSSIADHVCWGTLERVQADQQINLAMTSVLWGTQEISKYRTEPGYGRIEVKWTGSANWYLGRRQDVRNEAAKAKQQA